MNAVETIEAAKAAGVEIAVDGAELSLKASERPPPAVLEALRQNKQEIIALLSDTEPPPTRWLSADWRAFFDERAGIAEFDGELPRAERRAFIECVIEIQKQHPKLVPDEATARRMLAEMRIHQPTGTHPPITPAASSRDHHQTERKTHHDDDPRRLLPAC